MYKKLILIALVLAFSGCATNRGIVDLTVENVANPKTGDYVKIIKVTDNRKFELAPNSPSTPSLKNGEIHDPAITSRAIARKRNGFGKALGDILLPEGKTVSGLVKDAVAASLKKAGYRVVEAGDSHYSQATPIEVQVETFWGWFTPGFWAVTLEFQSDVELKGNIKGLKKSPTVHGAAQVKTAMAATGSWVETFNQGLQDLIENIRKALK